MSATRLAIALLLQDSPVAAIVGARVYPVSAPQGTALPYIVVSLVSESSDYVLAGSTGGRDSRIEVACYGGTFAEVDTLGRAAIAALDVINRTVSTTDSPPVGIGLATILKTSTDVTDNSEDRHTSLRIFRRLMDFRVRWAE